MAVGKNKRLSKGKKGLKKKTVDPFTKKDWYHVKAPSYFAKREIGKTIVNRSAGLKIADDSLKGRVFDVSLGDLATDPNHVKDSFRKFQLRIDAVNDKNCLTDFHGMSFTAEKIRSLVRKFQTLIEGHVDVKTTDGYLLRLFCVAFTKKQKLQVSKTTYAQASHVRQIRKKMFEIMTNEVASSSLKEVVAKLIPDTIGKSIEKSCQTIFPIQNVFVNKVKVVKSPKFDMQRLVDAHGKI